MQRKELLDKLELVSLALATDDMVPVFQCFTFHDKYITAYNDTLGIVADCDVDGSFAVNGPVLLGLLRNSIADTVDFKVEPESVLIKAGKSSLRMPYLTKEEFLFEPPDMSKAIEVVDDALIAGLNACLLTSSTDYAQPALMGVCLHQDAYNMVLYSSDGDAISRFKMKAPPAKASNRILPNAFCQALSKITTETKAQKVALSVSEEWAVGLLGTGYGVYGRLLQVDNPLDYEAGIKEMVGTKANAYAIPDGLDQALSRARVIADPESAKTILTIYEGYEGNQLKLMTESHMGIVRDSMLLPSPGQKNVTANVSAQLLQRCLGLCDRMFVRNNCVELWGNDTLYILTSNIGD